MDDSTIIELYFERSENAVAESENKYGKICRRIADNILHNFQDTEECVNDTWLTAWNRIPPHKPEYLGAFFAKITRNLSVTCLRKKLAEKRKGTETDLCIEELSECLADFGQNKISDSIEIRDCLNLFLESLNKKQRVIFMKRYWYVYSIEEIAGDMSMNVGAVKMSLSRTRNKLKAFLESEGITV